MSYDIELKDPVTKRVIELDAVHMMTGGTYAMGGTREAWLNVTYNYSRWYYKAGVFPEFKDENAYNGKGAEYGPSMVCLARKALPSSNRQSASWKTWTRT